MSALKAFSRLLQRATITNASRSFHIYPPDQLTPARDKEPDWKTAEDAMQVIESGNKVFVHSCAATPNYLLEAMCKHGMKNNLRDVDLIHIPTVGPATYNNEEYEGIFRSKSLFIGANCRKAVAEGRADTVPIFLGEIPLLFRRNIYRLDVALIHVSPPDHHGFCSLGASVDCTRSAVQQAKYIIEIQSSDVKSANHWTAKPKST